MIGSGALVDGRYRLESIIGAGGMGVVWAATHERLDRKVALEQIPLVVPGGEPAERIRARTLREARITASLNEVDGVVRIANYFDDEHNVWLELEYLDALNLAELIQATGGLPPAEVAWIGARVARALAGGHELEPPVQHRDIKPGNVLVSRDAAAVKLSDYGISRRDGDPAVTMIGAIHATLPYAAPEVVREHFTTVESDIWSLGATLYHAVEGPPALRRPRQQPEPHRGRACRRHPAHGTGGPAVGADPGAHARRQPGEPRSTPTPRPRSWSGSPHRSAPRPART